MTTTARLHFSQDVTAIVYERIADLTKKKQRKVTISDALESLIKDAYLSKTWPTSVETAKTGNLSTNP